MMSNLNWVDILILCVFLFSVLAGLMRGLVKEIISLLTWIAAFIIAIIFSSKLAALFTGTQQVQSAISSASNAVGTSAAQSISVLSVGVSFIILFVGTLLIGSIIGSIISKAVDSVGIGFINRFLGGVFGLARAFLLVLVGMFLIQLTTLQQQPWWVQSQFVSSFQPAVVWLGGVVAPGLASLKDTLNNTIQNIKSNQTVQGAFGH